MKRRSIIIAGVALAALVTASVAYGLTTTYSVTSTAASNKTGSTKSPAAFTPSFNAKATPPDGGRPLAPLLWTWSWNGVVINGKGFPTCTSAQIDAAQSDSVCPKGSLVGEGPFAALVGPEGDPNTNISCSGKTVRLYNAGAKTFVFYVRGPAEHCAGVGYLPPVTGKLVTSGGSTKASAALGENLIHPLPGVDGAVPVLTMQYKKISRKSGGKTLYYISSTSCAGKRRTITFTVKSADGPHTSTGSVGKCT